MRTHAAKAVMDMGVGRSFSSEGAIVDFPGVAKNVLLAGRPKVAKCRFTHSKPRKHFFCSAFDEKMSNFKIHGKPWPSRRPWSWTCLNPRTNYFRSKWQPPTEDHINQAENKNWFKNCCIYFQRVINNVISKCPHCNAQRPNALTFVKLRIRWSIF